MARHAALARKRVRVAVSTLRRRGGKRIRKSQIKA